MSNKVITIVQIRNNGSWIVVGGVSRKGDKLRRKGRGKTDRTWRMGRMSG